MSCGWALTIALDPSSDFPDAPLDSPQQLQAVADNQGPAGSHQGMQTGDKMAIKAPVAGKSGQQDQRGDTVAGINKGVGDFVAGLGDTEAGHKGAGGVDFSNAAGMGGL
ncbi:hypothetical protein OEZ85_005556 [Tetradesmus obliquus]|uniref:Uncharacterized protein n=1 Tax=Tetradesmus obliquus TaxID=3088 RepID=A0ABY8UE22_TETOB|nr:hypothetical protein OEZ85_005556 [Tetradesmus obliquus]